MLPVVSAVILLVAVLVAALLWLYVKTPANMAFVRTGLGGRHVVVDGGAIVLPVVQHVQWISLETSKLEVKRQHREAFITRDRYRVDIGAEFYVKVPPEVAAIERASRSLGERSFSAERIKALVEEKLVAALRADAAQRDLVALHENRRGFAQAVMETLREALLPNGLALEEVSLFHLDQTPKEHLDPNNIFDAEGLRQITAQTAERQKERNEIERNTEVAIKRKDIEAVKLKLGLDQVREFAEADQRKQVEVYRAEREAETGEFRSQQGRRIREAEIQAQQEVREAELRQEAHVIQQARERDVAEVEKEREVELARRIKEIAILAKERERLEEEQRRLESDSKREAAAQQVMTTTERLAAERERELAVIQAGKDVDVAARRAEAAQELALARVREGEAEAQVLRLRHEAENRLDDKVIRRDVLLSLIDRAPHIVEAMTAPVGKIDSIRIVDLGGARGEGAASPVSRLASSFLEAGMALPLLRELLQEARTDPAQWASTLLDQLAGKAGAPGGEAELPAAR